MATFGFLVILALFAFYLGFNNASAAFHNLGDSQPGEEKRVRHSRCIGSSDDNSLSNRQASPLDQRFHDRYIQSHVTYPYRRGQRLGQGGWRNRRDDHAGRRVRSPETRDLDYHVEEGEEGEGVEGKTETTTRTIVTVFPPYRERFALYPRRWNNPSYPRYPGGTNSNYRVLQ